MDFIKKLIKKYYQYIPNFILKLIPVRNIVVESYSGCNVTCLSCPVDIIKRKGELKPLNYYRIIDQIKTLKHIDLFFMGEPFLNKYIFSMIRINKNHNIRTTINTNSTFLYRDYKKIVHSGLNKLILSLDGINPDTHNRYRVGTNFDEVINGMYLLSKYMKKQNSKMIVEVRTLMFKDVEKELNLLKHFVVNQLGFTHREIEPIITGWGNKENIKAEEIKNDNYVRNKKLSYCNAIFRVVILYNGNMVICCNDVHGNYSYGNIFDTSFKKLYYSNKGINLRKMMSKKELDICKNCGEDYL